MRLACVIAAAAAATATPPRGFLLVATNLPVQLLRSDADADWRRDELGCVLRDICAQEKYPATVVVGRDTRPSSPRPTAVPRPACRRGVRCVAAVTQL